MGTYNLDYVISAVDKFSPAISRINNEIKEAQSKMSTYTKAMDKWGHGVQTFGVSMTKYVTAPIISAGAAALYESSKFEGYARTLRYVTGSAKEGREMLDRLFEFEGRTPFDAGSLVGAVKRLHDIGYSANGAVNLMKKLGDVAAGSGADIEQLAFTYGRVAMRGKMTSREMMQFMRMGVPVAEIAKAMGMSTQKLAFLAQHSMISAQQMQKAFEKLSGEGGIFHGAMRDKMNTFAVSLSKVKDASERIAGKMGDIILKTLPIVPLLHRVAEFLDRLAVGMGAFAKDNPALMKLIAWAALFAAAMGPVIAAVGTFMISVGAIMTMLPGFLTALAGFKVVFLSTLGPIGLAVVALSSLAVAMAEVIYHWDTLKSVFSSGGLKDLAQYMMGSQAEYLGPQGHQHTSQAAAVQEFNQRSSFNGKLEITAPQGTVKKVSSALTGPGSFDLGLNMSTAMGYH